MTTPELLIYASIPNLDTPALVALADELLLSAPQKPDELVRRASKRLRTALSAVRDAMETRSSEGVPDVSRKVAKRGVDTAWGALHRRLSAWLDLPDHVERKARAAALFERLFPDGLSLLSLGHKALWTEGDKRLGQVASESLTAEVEELVGREFLEELHAAQRLYGEVLGLLETPQSVPPLPLVSEPLQALRQAIRAFAIRIVAEVEEDDPASVALALRVLAPIANARASRASLSDDEATPLEDSSGS